MPNFPIYGLFMGLIFGFQLKFLMDHRLSSRVDAVRLGFSAYPLGCECRCPRGEVVELGAHIGQAEAFGLLPGRALWLHA